MKTAPHYLLLTGTEQSAQFNDENRATTATGHSIAPTGGRWHFVLEPIHYGVRIEADDIEPGVFGERLNLLAVVRGLEALDQPSQVTLITPSKVVGRGIRRDISLWKESNWQWDRFGQRVDIKHRDLWQRIERAMQFHQIDCRIFGAGQPQHFARSSRQLKDLSRATEQTNPYSAPFVNSVGHSTPFAGDDYGGKSGGGEGNVNGSGNGSANGSANESGVITGAAPSTATAVTAAPAKPVPSSHRRKIVLTTDRMNDKDLALDDVAGLEARHQKLFKATRTGWTRVTEIDADSPLAGKMQAAFGCSAN